MKNDGTFTPESGKDHTDGNMLMQWSTLTDKVATGGMVNAYNAVTMK